MIPMLRSTSVVSDLILSEIWRVHKIASKVYSILAGNIDVFRKIQRQHFSQVLLI